MNNFDAVPLPKVSVGIVTYNHEAYIEQCVRSALEQQTTFDFEVIVGDDCSTDSTREILLRLQAEYPEKLKLILHANNINGTRNYFAVHNAARGEYVAHIDGDDYWLPEKLQFMHDIMEKNPDVNIAWHRVFIEVEDGARVVGMPMMDPLKLFGSEKLSFGQLIRWYGVTGQHSASIYRRKARKKFVVEPGERVVDYFHTLMLCEDGYAMYVDKVFSVYRTYYEHQRSVTSTPGAPVVANALIHMMRHYIEKMPQFRKEICAQAIMQGLIRGWFGFKEWRNFITLARSTNSMPRARDFCFILKVFKSERNSIKQRRLNEWRLERFNKTAT
jgi:glycosyltransferase involved in cell wall biosynthesis